MNHNQSHVIKHQQCPKCKLNGKDNSHDNMALYSDGHSYCYSCGYSSYPNKTKNYGKTSTKTVQKSSLLLPEDCTTEYPEKPRNWIEQYELTETDLLLNNVLWSSSISRLIFPIYGNNFDVIAWQGRYFGDNLDIQKKQKWFGRGNLRDTFNILGTTRERLILCEDIVSAIKISNCNVMAMPLYGCIVGRERLKRLYTRFGGEVEVSVWLDPDKRSEAIKESKLGLLCGLRVRTILSDKDPKEHSYEEIKEILK